MLSLQSNYILLLQVTTRIEMNNRIYLIDFVNAFTTIDLGARTVAAGSALNT